MRMLQTNVRFCGNHIRWQAHGKAEYMLMHIPIHIAIMELMYCFVMVACLLSVGGNAIIILFVYYVNRLKRIFSQGDCHLSANRVK